MNETPNFELPQTPSQSPMGQVTDDSVPSVASTSAQQVIPEQSIQQTSAINTYAQAPTASPMPQATGMVAEDVDLIEKEWVEKAKSIVAQTKYDPFLQNKELVKMKAEYLKARYRKDIKVVEE